MDIKLIARVWVLASIHNGVITQLIHVGGTHSSYLVPSSVYFKGAKLPGAFWVKKKILLGIASCDFQKQKKTEGQCRGKVCIE